MNKIEFLSIITLFLLLAAVYTTQLWFVVLAMVPLYLIHKEGDKPDNMGLS